MGFGDYETARKMRDALVPMVERVVNRMRPEPRIGQVTDFDPGGNLAQVKFPGSLNSLKVRFSPALAPRAIGDVVRVGGKPSAYYILEVLSTSPYDQIIEPRLEALEPVTEWVDFSSSCAAGTLAFPAAPVTRARYSRIGRDVHVNIQKSSTAGYDQSANVTGNFTNAVVLGAGSVPPEARPVTIGCVGSARWDDTPVVVFLGTDGSVTVVGGFPRNWASGEVLHADFRFHTDAAPA